MGPNNNTPDILVILPGINGITIWVICKSIKIIGAFMPYLFI